MLKKLMMVKKSYECYKNLGVTSENKLDQLIDAWLKLDISFKMFIFKKDKIISNIRYKKGNLELKWKKFFTKMSLTNNIQEMRPAKKIQRNSS